MPLTPTTHNEDHPSYYLERGWTQDDMAVNIHGDECSPHSEQAVAHCLLGSVQAAAPYMDMDEERTLRRALTTVIKRNYADRLNSVKKSSTPTSHSELVTRANDQLIKSQDEALKVMREAEAESGVWDD